MMTPLKQLDDDGRKTLKTIAFYNAMMKAMPDQRNFIRDIKILIRTNVYSSYFEDQLKISQSIKDKFDLINVHSKEDVDIFADDNSSITAELQLSLEKALLRLHATVLKNKPIENESKCIDLLMEVNRGLIDPLLIFCLLLYYME